MTSDLDDMEQKLRDLWEVSKPKSALARNFPPSHTMSHQS